MSRMLEWQKDWEEWGTKLPCFLLCDSSFLIKNYSESIPWHYFVSSPKPITMVTHPVHSLPLTMLSRCPDQSSSLLHQHGLLRFTPFPLPSSQAPSDPLHRKSARATQLAVRLLAGDIGTPTVGNPRRPTRTNVWLALPPVTDKQSQPPSPVKINQP